MFSHLGSGWPVILHPTYRVIIIRKQDLRPRLTQAMSFFCEQVDIGLPPSIQIRTFMTSIVFLNNNNYDNSNI